MQRPKFDLRRLRNVRVQDLRSLRDRTFRLRYIQTLGTQVTRLRQVQMRGEYLVPAAAFLILVLALFLSWGASQVREDDVPGAVAEPSDVVELPGAGGTPTTTGGPSYPAPGATSTGAAIGTLPSTATAGLDSGVITGTVPYTDTGYPSADEPIPLGTPGAGVPGFEPPPTPEDFVIAPGLPGDQAGGFVPAPMPTPAPFVPPVTSGGGSIGSVPPPYPAPATSDEPDPQIPAPPIVFPTPPPRAVAPVNPPVRPPPPSSGITLAPSPTRAIANPGSTYPAPANPQPTSAGGTGAGGGTNPPPPPPPGATAPAGGASQPAEATSSPPTETPPPPSTPTPAPTDTPAPTPTPVPTATATPEPVTRIEGNVRWTAANSPVVVDQDVVVVPGSSLQIDPGVDVRVRAGMDIFVEGQLFAAGAAGAPVRFLGVDGRWTAIAGQPGSSITLNNAEVRSAGRGGTAVSSNGGQLTLGNVLVTDGGGGIAGYNARVDIQDSAVTGNDLPGPAVTIGLAPDRPVTLRRNIFGGNLVPGGTPQVRLFAGNAGNGPLDIQGNGFAGANSPLLEIQTNSPIGGTIRCNSFQAGSVGLQLNANTSSARGFGLVVDSNAFEQQAVYGVASTIALDAANNWWGDPSGPAEATRNPEGAGSRAGVNVNFAPHLTARPECAPAP